ncbi:glycosyltransferase [Novosphingobium sp. BL-8A]|uniref:glycosyltransferase n=1 Tax=Novosphingobium sp. BL-8A TaxID=3127639 RepID=UPI003756D913
MTGALRIAIPIHSFEPGGVERVALNLARKWQEIGHDVVIVLGRDEGLDRENAPRTLNYRCLRSMIPTARFESIWMMWSMFRFLLRDEADVIFCPGNTYTVVCVLMKALFGRRCPPVIVKVSNDLVRADKSPLRRRWYGKWLKINGFALDRFVALAEPMADEIIERMGVAAHRVSTVHDPALDGDRLDRLLALDREIPGHRPMRYLAVGRLARQKNLPMLLCAFAAGSRPSDRLTIVGDGCHRAALEAEVRRLAIGDRVVFAGHVASPDRHYQDADCLLLASRFEGVPAVVIEAIAAGLPVVATDCAVSMAMLLGNGTRGMLVPVSDVDALAAAIACPERLPVLDAAARSFAARFTLENAAQSYLRLMQATIADAQAAENLDSLEVAGR